MTKAHKAPSGRWFALYRAEAAAQWRIAKDALGRALRCETEELALSVAAYRLQRLKPLEA